MHLLSPYLRYRHCSAFLVHSSFVSIGWSFSFQHFVASLSCICCFVVCTPDSYLWTVQILWVVPYKHLFLSVYAERQFFISRCFMSIFFAAAILSIHIDVCVSLQGQRSARHCSLCHISDHNLGQLILPCIFIFLLLHHTWS